MTTANITEVVFHGFMAKKYGKKHKVNASTILLANMQLKANLGHEFHKDLLNGRWKVIRGAFNTAQPDYVDSMEVEMGTSKKTIHIIPEGIASNGVMKIILGVVMVVVGAIAFFVFDQPWGVSMMLSGAAMVAGGIADMLAPHPASQNSNPTLNSYSFSGGTNITSQGTAHPLAYGRAYCTSVQVSTGLGVQQLKDQVGT
jgi:predicted phage tail protein